MRKVLAAPRLRARVWLLLHLPPGLVARPFEWFLAALCLVSALTTAMHLSSSGVDATAPPLPEVALWLWCACLAAGALGMMCGLSSIKLTALGMHVVTRVPCYRFGLRLLLTASVVYGAAIASVGEWGGTVSLVLLAAACFLRLLTLSGRQGSK